MIRIDTMRIYAIFALIHLFVIKCSGTAFRSSDNVNENILPDSPPSYSVFNKFEYHGSNKMNRKAHKKHWLDKPMYKDKYIDETPDDYPYAKLLGLIEQDKTTEMPTTTTRPTPSTTKGYWESIFSDDFPVYTFKGLTTMRPRNETLKQKRIDEDLLVDLHYIGWVADY